MDKPLRVSLIDKQIMWNRLIAVVEEQAQALQRTAFSTIVRESGDLAAGVLAFVNPILTSKVLTLFMACALLVSGLFRIWVAMRSKEERGWGWLLAGGIVTALAGLVFLIGWPVNSLWLLGLFLAFDLAMQGWALIGFGLALRKV